MPGWRSETARDVQIEALRIPPELKCPGSGQMTSGGRCVVCGQRVALHSPHRTGAQTHKLVAWMMERTGTIGP